ncbi:copper chaperone PCu(A)C [Mycetohabitans sp. B8]|uniref:copper chaperone PCu(A)C n=1 Tax=Mycetohabitans sp. B8 TaxID=2841845 RepID=UPI001F2F87D0|nr:copper chaperone PCu(A)C [Mycetohabitans sp. B8]
MQVKTLIGAAAALFAMLSAAAQASGLAGVQVSGCWVRTMPATLPSSAYFTIKNDADKPVSLKGVDAPAFGMVMMHQTQSNGSTSRMVHVDALDVPAHSTLQFAPGGYHVMLEQPQHALKVGTTIPLTLNFGAAGKLDVQCELRPASAPAH